MMRLLTVLALALMPALALAHDSKRPDLDSWFDGLRSGKGPCCSNADGNVVIDADWDSKDDHYRVRIEGEWIDIPDDAVIKEPNRDGRTIVWPFYVNGHPQVRCFMPGSMT